MKNTLLKVWGIVLTVAILAGLLLIAAPVSAANLSWSTLGSPAVVTTTVANVYAFANNGKTVLLYDGTKLNQSLDGGLTWASSNLGTGLVAPIKSIVIDPTNPIYMVATNGTSVYRSQNSGVNWSTFNPAGAPATVTSIDTTTDAYGEVVLIGYDAAGYAGGVALYENGTWYTTWAPGPLLGTAAATAGNWGGVGSVATSAYAVKLSPNYPNDGAIEAVAGNGTNIRLRTIISSALISGGTPGWGLDVVDATLIATPAVAGATIASIDMPSDFYWASSATNHVFVGLGDNTGATPAYANIYRVDGVLSGTPRVPLLYAGIDVASLDYQGSSTAGVLAVGQYNSTTVLTSTDAITITSLTAGSTWIASVKNPTGPASPVMLVRFTVVGTTTNLYAGTAGAQSALALATSANSYASFNEIAFVSVSALANVSLPGGPGGRSGTGSVTTFQVLNDSVNAVGMLFKSVDSGATWQEIYSLPTSFAFSVALSPTFATDSTIYLYAAGQSRIYKSIDGGATFNINATYGNAAISTLSAIDGTNYWFAYTNGTGVRSTLSTSALVNLNGLAPNPIINYGTFIQASTPDDDIWVSTDGGVTFASIGVPAVTGVTAARALVSATDPATKTVYALDLNNNIWSYTIGTSTSWTQFLTSTILTGTGGITGITGNTSTPGTIAINGITKGTGAWYFRSNNNPNGEIWRSTNLASGSFESVTGSAYVPATFGTPASSLTSINDKTTGNNTLIMAVGYTGTTVTPNTYNYKWVTYTDSVLAAPATIAPAASANLSATVDFSWKAVPNATSYDVQIAYDSAFNNIFKQQIAVPSTSTYYPSTIWAQVSLNPGQTYYWRVRVSLTSPMASTWSAGVMFTTQLGSVSSTGIDVGRYPTPGATAVSTNSFSWGTVAGATTYEFKISTKADFSDIVDSSVGLTGTVYQTLAKLNPGTTYFWEVRAVAGTVTGPWVTATFTTATTAQANPTATSQPVVTVPQATIIIPTQPAPIVNVTVPTPTNGNTSNSTPAWAWVVIAIAAVLVIAVIVLIARTRRV